MKSLNFPLDHYLSFVDSVYIYQKTSTSIVGSLELLWSVIENSEVSDLTKKDHKTNKDLKESIRSITIFKDKDLDSRISLESQTLILEDEQYLLLKRHLESSKFTSKVSDDVCKLWEIIDSAQDYKLPTLVRDA